ncbi:MAG TPA: streptomycin biosynthesis protein [Pseudonocardiaceae bacterium]|nr:streptomycin biosynthesis protein [Pseudonocardiaceae bacterium]
MITVPIDSLIPAHSPRLDGENLDHVRLLAESEDILPPILVHRGSMRIVDGMHRLRVAQLRGDAEVRIEYFEGTELEAFVRGVELNVTHGLPLTRADREAAAAHIIESSDRWSDRAIAQMTGLSAPTIGKIRALAVPDRSAESEARIGRDGRVRPLNSALGRQRASELIAAEPNLSLREIAKRAGISQGTARDVRKRVSRGEDPIPARFLPGTRPAPTSLTSPAAAYPIDMSYVSDLNNLQKDPSLRLTGSGRFLLRWFRLHAISQEKRINLIKSLPNHNRARIAYLAKCCSRWWAEFAQAVEQQQEECHDMPNAS